MEPAQVGLALITIGGALLGLSIILAVIGHFRTIKKTFPSSFQYEDIQTSRFERFSFVL